MFRVMRVAMLTVVLGLALAAWPSAVLAQAHEPGAPPAREPTHAAPAAGEASHEAHEKGELLAPLKQGLPAMIAAFLVFGIVYVVLQKKVWPMLNAGLSARAGRIREEIMAAEVARQQAREALDSYQKSLSEARAEAQRMLEKTKADQQVFADELRAKADAELTAMKDRARRDIEAAKRQALADIYAETAGLATRIAGKILQREVNAADSQRLVDESLKEMQARRN